MIRPDNNITNFAKDIIIEFSMPLSIINNPRTFRIGPYLMRTSAMLELDRIMDTEVMLSLDEIKFCTLNGTVVDAVTGIVQSQAQALSFTSTEFNNAYQANS